MIKVKDGVSVGALLRQPAGPRVEDPYREALLAVGGATNALVARPPEPEPTSEELLASISKMVEEVVAARVARLEEMVTIFKHASVGRTEDILRTMVGHKMPPLFLDEMRAEYYEPLGPFGPGRGDALGALMMMNEIAASTRRRRRDQERERV